MTWPRGPDPPLGREWSARGARGADADVCPRPGAGARYGAAAGPGGPGRDRSLLRPGFPEHFPTEEGGTEMYELPAVTSEENRTRYECARDRWERRKRGRRPLDDGPRFGGKPIDLAEAARIFELAGLLGID